MARKTTSAGKIGVARKSVVKTISSTPVRHSAIPKSVFIAPVKEITAQQIASKAYEIYASGKGGSELDHWFAAERALRSAA